MTIKEVTKTEAPPEHPYVVRVSRICDGRPTIRGTRTPVSAIVGHYKMGESVDEILAALPHLTPAQVLDALSYYHDHQEEMEVWLREHTSQEKLLKAHHLTLDEHGNVVPCSDED
ncbi:MAG: hypothetical protein MAG451_03007 [Anaerolineales bacterium]|nr:hypothetical protein [Anaerolineales bacterium]